MYILRTLHLLWLVPASWIDAILVRRKPFEERYAHMSRWSSRLMKIFKIRLQIHVEDKLPQDKPILFVCNHQLEFDMLLQMAAIHIPFTYISKKENEKVPYVSSWAKTLNLIYFDRDDQSSAISMLREASRRLKNHQNLLIFPEGTRAKGKTMHEMQAGSLQPAFMAKAVIVPIVLENSYDFFNLVKQKGTAKIHILKPYEFEDYKPLKADGLIQELQTKMQAILDGEQS